MKVGSHICMGSRMGFLSHIYNCFLVERSALIPNIHSPLTPVATDNRGGKKITVLAIFLAKWWLVERLVIPIMISSNATTGLFSTD